MHSHPHLSPDDCNGTRVCADYKAQLLALHRELVANLLELLNILVAKPSMWARQVRARHPGGCRRGRAGLCAQAALLLPDPGGSCCVPPLFPSVVQVLPVPTLPLQAGCAWPRKLLSQHVAAVCALLAPMQLALAAAPLPAACRSRTHRRCCATCSICATCCGRCRRGRRCCTRCRRSWNSGGGRRQSSGGRAAAQKQLGWAGPGWAGYGLARQAGC